MNITLTEVYIVLWELFVFNNLCELKFCTGKFSYKSICTNNCQDNILLLQNVLFVLLERNRTRWRSSEETVVFAATLYTKRYGGKLVPSLRSMWEKE